MCGALSGNVLHKGIIFAPAPMRVSWFEMFGMQNTKHCYRVEYIEVTDSLIHIKYIILFTENNIELISSYQWSSYIPYSQG